MGEESPNSTVTPPTGAVFLSYASEDAVAAERIATALRAAGVEVWFDKSELRGGDAWDHRIREQIHDCRLFIPVISANSERRDEGYFRREWALAADRTRDMAQKRAFLVPVVIDGTPERGSSVPDKFHELQWTRLPEGAPSTAFIERVQRLLSQDASTAPSALHGGVPRGLSSNGQLTRVRSKAWIVVAAVVAVVAVPYFAFERLLPTRTVPSVAGPVTAPSAVAAGFNPPPHSIAVLPFVNMSGDKEQEYFSDGLTEELLNSLSRINKLQVAARTSSFSFQGEHPDIATVAHKLNVGAVLEGSVRRSANTVRITTQLVNGVTGFHLWTETYDRDLGDVLKLQTEIATAVASALKVALLGDEAAKIEVGGTHNPAAFDAYLRATNTYFRGQNGEDNEAAIARYTEAIRLDPNYALAYAARALAASNFADSWAPTISALRDALDNAQVDARKSIALAPEMGEGHLALATVYENLLKFAPATEEYERALTLAPGSARVMWNYGRFSVLMGHSSSGLTALRRAVALDPLNDQSHGELGTGLLGLRRYPEAVAVFKNAQAMDPGKALLASAWLGNAYYLLGDLQEARSYCESRADVDDGQFCLAITYDKLGRHADAERMLAKARLLDGDTGSVWYAWTYAQWGNRLQALDWLETAMRLRDPELKRLKNPLLDPLRNEPRFQALERELKFPD